MTFLSRIALFTVLVAACGTGKTQPLDAGGPEPDAGDGRDAGPKDGGLTRDGGVDGGLDGGSDLPDAGEDDPNWVAVEGLPEGCDVDWARDPAKVWSPEMEPCPDDEPCQQVIVNGLGFAGVSFVSGTGGHDGDRGYYAVGFDFALEDLRPKVIVADTEGRTYGAWRNTRLSDETTCGFGRTAFSKDGRSVAWVIPFRRDDAPWRTFIYHARVDDLARAHEPLAVFADDELPGRSLVQDLVTSGTTVVAYSLPPRGSTGSTSPAVSWTW